MPLIITSPSREIPPAPSCVGHVPGGGSPSETTFATCSVEDGQPAVFSMSSDAPVNGKFTTETEVRLAPFDMSSDAGGSPPS